MIRLVSQFEVAYVKDDQQVLWHWFPSPGFYFLPTWRELPADSTFDDAVGALQDLVIDEDDLRYV
jgi:hypothetical protein